MNTVLFIMASLILISWITMGIFRPDEVPKGTAILIFFGGYALPLLFIVCFFVSVFVGT